MVQNPEFERSTWFQWVDCRDCGISFPRKFDSLRGDPALVVIFCVNCTSRNIKVDRWCLGEVYENWDWTWENTLDSYDKINLMWVVHNKYDNLDKVEKQQINKDFFSDLLGSK